MRLQLSDLRRAADALFDHLERTGRTEIEITEGLRPLKGAAGGMGPWAGRGPRTALARFGAWEPPAACIPENGVGLGSLVDVYK